MQQPEAEFLLFENYSHSSFTLSSKDNGTYCKNKQKNKCVCVREIMRLFIIKRKMKMWNRSHRCDINRPGSWYEHKYSEYKMCLNMMMFICIEQHLSKIWSSTHEKLSSTEAELKKACNPKRYKKKLHEKMHF